MTDEHDDLRALMRFLYVAEEAAEALEAFQRALQLLNGYGGAQGPTPYVIENYEFPFAIREGLE